MLLIELGAVGLLAFLSISGTAIVSMAVLRRRVPDPTQRSLAIATIASIVAGVVGLALFDGFAFPMATGTLFLVLGLAGAQWRLASRPSIPPTMEPVGRIATKAAKPPKPRPPRDDADLDTRPESTRLDLTGHARQDTVVPPEDASPIS